MNGSQGFGSVGEGRALGRFRGRWGGRGGQWEGLGGAGMEGRAPGRFRGSPGSSLLLPLELVGVDLVGSQGRGFGFSIWVTKARFRISALAFVLATA